MALFNRQRNSDIPPELQPYYDAPVATASGNNWLRWVLMAVAGVVAVIILIFLIHWAWHEAHTTGKPATSSTNARPQTAKKNVPTDSERGRVGSSEGNQTTKPAPSGAKAPATPSSQPAPAPAQAPSPSTAAGNSDDSDAAANSAAAEEGGQVAQSPTPPATSSVTGQAAATKLANTGPGSTVVIFVIAMLSGIALYQYWLRNHRSVKQ